MKKKLHIMRSCTLLLLLLVVLGICIGLNEAQLAYNYYETSCPNVEEIVRKEMFGMLSSDPSAAAAILRLFFHDCQVQGCDASILLDTNDSEMLSSKNFGIKKREDIGLIKAILEAECPGKVSCADIIVLTARESVAFSGGPLISVPLGRKDSITASYDEADAQLPLPSTSVDKLLNIFMAKGMDLDESVAILGAHTLGAGHCINIVNRLYQPDPSDTMDLPFRLFLKLNCPSLVPLTNLTVVPNDVTPTAFDNQYYRDVAVGKGLFGVDSSISRDPRTAPVVARFAVDQEGFFQTFASAFTKLSLDNVLSDGSGEVRLVCNQVN